MALRVGLLNFSKGEIAEELIARIDVPSYSAALKQARNVVVLKYGGITKRPGTRLVAVAYGQDDPVRLLPFQFSLDQAYALELGQGYMRAAAGGGLVLETALKATAITKAAHAQVTVAYHGYAVGDQVYFAGIEGMVQINGQTGAVLSVVDGNNFTVDIDTTSYSTFTDSDGTVRVGAPAPDPTPPVVTPPTPPPAVPPTTGSGGDPYSGGAKPIYCVTVDTLILMADGSQKPAGELREGDLVRTRHESTLMWGEYPVEAATIARDQPLFAAEIEGKALRGTGDHRVWIDGEWKRLRNIGKPDGRGDVAKLTVEHAHTYVSNGLLSHNIKRNSVHYQ